MNFEPKKFYISLIDFFSILLPGALATYLLKETDWAVNFEFISHLNKQGAEGTVVFLFCSYLLGHFLFLIGSWLDDFVYDPIRKRTEEKQIENLYYGRKLSPLLIRGLTALLFKKRPNNALCRVIKIKETYLDRIGAPEAINAYQWCKLRLSQDNPQALEVVKSFEANSKFFRSFLPVLVFLFAFIFIPLMMAFAELKNIGIRVFFIHKSEWILAVCLLVFLWLALWRYAEQRFKATQLAYWAVLTLESSVALAQNQEGENKSDKDVKEPTHAGGVVYRRGPYQSIEYLLVRAKNNPKHWVLPKGHIEEDEKEAICALREVREETGVWARIVKEEVEENRVLIEKDVDLGISSYFVNKKNVRIRFFLMSFLKKGKSREKRELKWLPLEEVSALGQSIHDETKSMLKLAEKKRVELSAVEKR